MGILIFQQIMKYFIMIMMGYFMVRTGFLQSKDSRILSALSVYLILPCAILNSFQINATAEGARNLTLSFVTAILIHIVLILAGKLFQRLFRMDGVETASLIYSNSGNMILPLVEAVLGGEWTLYASAYMSVQTFLLWTHGKSVICQEPEIRWQKILLNINVFAIIGGVFLFFTGIKLPGIIDDTFDMVGGMLAPAGMVVIGMLLAGVNLGKVFKNRRLYFICFLRLLLLPVSILLMIYIFQIMMPGKVSNTLLFISFIATTTAVSTSVMQMAQVYGKNVEYASAVNVMSTVLSLITMPLLSGLYTWLLPLSL